MTAQRRRTHRSRQAASANAAGTKGRHQGVRLDGDGFLSPEEFNTMPRPRYQFWSAKSLISSTTTEPSTLRRRSRRSKPLIRTATEPSTQRMRAAASQRRTASLCRVVSAAGPVLGGAKARVSVEVTARHGTRSSYGRGRRGMGPGQDISGYGQARDSGQVTVVG